MNYGDWLNSVPEDIKKDSLWRMEVFRLSLFSVDLAWNDVTKLMRDKRTLAIADQLNRAIGSLSANIAEGYSRQSGKDQARFYEYALGSAREARNWYYQSRHILTEEVATHRVQLITQIIRLLLSIIPMERGYKLKEEPVNYGAPEDSAEQPPRMQ
jgi:four helix bundle protein